MLHLYKIKQMYHVILYMVFCRFKKSTHYINAIHFNKVFIKKGTLVGDTLPITHAFFPGCPITFHVLAETPYYFSLIQKLTNIFLFLKLRTLLIQLSVICVLFSVLPHFSLLFRYLILNLLVFVYVLGKDMYN